MYQEEGTGEKVNMRQKAKPIILKVILKRPNLETIEEDSEGEVDINLRRGSNPYQYNVVDDFRWTLLRLFLLFNGIKWLFFCLLNRELYCLKLTRDYVTTLTNYKN